MNVLECSEIFNFSITDNIHILRNIYWEISQGWKSINYCDIKNTFDVLFYTFLDLQKFLYHTCGDSHALNYTEDFDFWGEKVDDVS